jgi:hypothetical protein
MAHSHEQREKFAGKLWTSCFYGFIIFALYGFIICILLTWADVSC